MWSLFARRAQPETRRENLSASLTIAPLVCVLSLLLPSTTLASPALIDSYTQPNAVLSVTTPGETDSSASTNLTTILGEERYVAITLSSGFGVNNSAGGGLSRFSTLASSGGNIDFVYDGAAGLPDAALDATGLGGVDLSDGGQEDAIRIEFAKVDRQCLLTITVLTDAGNLSNFSTTMLASASATSLVLPFENFIAQAGTGADFSNVGAIMVSLSLSQGDAADVDFDYLDTATTLSLSLADALEVDLGFDGFVNEGDTMRYTAIITNADDEADLAVPSTLFAVSPDPNSSLVVGSVTTTIGSVTTGNSGGDTTVLVDVGSVPDAATVTITFDVLVDDPLALGQPMMSVQGSVTTDWLPNLLTDDPDVSDTPTDPTLTPLTYCGSGVLDIGEVCDDAGESSTCDSDCTEVVCGDGLTNLSANEACDDAGESSTCNADCSEASCGDSIVNTTAGEACDDGAETPTCNADCTLSSCGDGVLNTSAGEVCDDAGESSTCNADCTAAECGDGVTNAAADEDCDDSGESEACNDDCTAAECGDGVLNVSAGENCDDGNSEDGDGCDSSCEEEEMGETGDSGDTSETGDTTDTGDTQDTGDTEDTGGESDTEDTGGESGGESGEDSTTDSTSDSTESGPLLDGGPEPSDGCDCRTTKTGAPPWAVLLLGLVVWRRRR